MIIDYKQYKINIKSINDISKTKILNNFDNINDDFFDICVQVLENLILNNIIINNLNISYNKNVYLNVSIIFYKNNETEFKNIYYDLHIYDLSYNNLMHLNNINEIYNSIINIINSFKKKID